MGVGTDILKTNTMPDTQTTALESILTFLTDIMPFAAAFGAAWKVVDALFKYFDNTRRDSLKEIVREVNDVTINPKVDLLAESIERLTKSVYALEDKINRMQ